MLQLIFGIASLLGVGSSLYGAKQASTEAKYNEKLKLEQAEMIGQKQIIVGSQRDREIARAGSTLMANVGASGIAFSGSPVDALIDMTTQMEMDKAIEQFNLEWEKRGVTSQADAYGKQSNTARNIGYANAFSKALSAGYDYYKEF